MAIINNDATNKGCILYILLDYNGILLGRKKEGTLTSGDNMDGPGKCYAKWNKPVKERQVPYDFTYIRNLMNKIN